MSDVHTICAYQKYIPYVHITQNSMSGTSKYHIVIVNSDLYVHTICIYRM
jgi:hypothetical protein